MGASPRNNSKVRLGGDVRLESDGTVRILPNVLQLSQVVRAAPGQQRERVVVTRTRAIQLSSRRSPAGVAAGVEGDVDP